MALVAQKRRIIIKTSTGEKDLIEPTPGASLEQIRLFNMAEYPELATCGVDTNDQEVTFKPDNGPEQKYTQTTSTFKPNTGTRG